MSDLLNRLYGKRLTHKKIYTIVVGIIRFDMFIQINKLSNAVLRNI